MVTKTISSKAVEKAVKLMGQKQEALENATRNLKSKQTAYLKAEKELKDAESVHEKARADFVANAIAVSENAKVGGVGKILS